MSIVKVHSTMLVDGPSTGGTGNGASGYSGYSGIPGSFISSGYSGISGYSGYSGSGVSGYSGYSGSGVSGYSGIGTSGYSGYSGAAGAVASTGTTNFIPKFTSATSIGNSVMSTDGTSVSSTGTFSVVGDGLEVIARASSNTGNVLIEAQASDYFSTPTFTGTGLRQYSALASGLLNGLPLSGLGLINFQNTNNNMIYTNTLNPIYVFLQTTEAGRFTTTGFQGAIGLTTPKTGNFTTLTGVTLGISSTPTARNPITLGGLATASTGSAIGIYCSATPTASVSNDSLYNVFLQPSFNTVASLTGLYAFNQIITTPNVTGSSGLNTSYQLYISDGAAATTKYGIYQNSTNSNYLGGSLWVNTQGNIIGNTGGSTTSPSYSSTNLMFYYSSPTNYAGLGTDAGGVIYMVAGVGAPVTGLTYDGVTLKFLKPTTLTSPSDNNVGNFKITSSNSNNAGLSLWTNGGTTMRNWQIQSNYAAAGDLCIFYSTSNVGNPTTLNTQFTSAGHSIVGGVSATTQFRVDVGAGDWLLNTDGLGNTLAKSYRGGAGNDWVFQSYGSFLFTPGNSTTGIASISTSGMSVSGIILDTYKANVRAIPQNSQTTGYTLIASDVGKHISITTGGVTVPTGVFSPGDAITIFNNSGSSQTITQGTGVTMRLAGSASTGNRTLAQYGITTVLCFSAANFVISGAGVT